jgi:hypothetical protein
MYEYVPKAWNLASQSTARSTCIYAVSSTSAK